MLMNANFHLECYCLINTSAFKKLAGQLTVCVKFLSVKRRILVDRVVDSILSKLLEKSWPQKIPVAVLL